MQFNERLAALRRAKGISQEVLAEQLSVSRQAVSKWETGTAKPELDNILALCRILEVSPNELLGNEPPADLQEAPVPKKRPVRNILLYCGGLVLLIFFGLCIRWTEDRGKAPELVSCTIVETDALATGREFTLKLTYSSLPEGQPNKLILQRAFSQDFADAYQRAFSVAAKNGEGYVTILIPYGADWTVTHQSKAPKMVYVFDLFRITDCTAEGYTCTPCFPTFPVEDLTK